MAMSSSSGFEQWVYGIGRSRHGRHGKMDIRRGSSVRSERIVALAARHAVPAIYGLGVATVDLPPEATMAGVPQLMLDTGGYPTNSSAPQGDPAVRATTAERPLAL
jgi:hypothetical protein